MPGRFRPWIWPIVLMLLAGAFYATVRHKRDLVDFQVYRTAGLRARTAEPLYRPQDGHYQFKYLPAFALMMEPVGLVDQEIAKALWFALSVGLLVAFVGLSVRELPAPRLTRSALIWLTLLLAGKFYVKELAFGQTNVLLGVVLVGALVAVRQGQDVVAGALVGLGVFIKPYAIVLIPWLLTATGVGGLAAFAIVLVAGLLVPAAVYGWAGNLDLLLAWWRTVTDTTAPNLLLPENISLATMWAKWIGIGTTASALTAVTAAVVVGVAAGMIVARRRVSDPGYLEFGALMLLIPLLSPQGWDYVLLLATPAIVCVVDRWRDLSTGWRAVTIATFFLMSFTIFDLLGRVVYVRLMAMSAVTVAACALLAILAHLRWRALA